MQRSFLLCDDHALFREGLAALFERQPEWQVIAQAADGEEAVRMASEHQPDVVVIDISMPRLDGIAATARIHEALPKTRIIALSMYGGEHYRRRMFEAGAKAYVMKSNASVELIDAVNAVLRDEIYVSPLLQTSKAPQQGSIDIDLSSLSSREHEIFRLLALGRRTKEIAEMLGISVKTVEAHRSRLMLKLGIDNLADLIKAAIRAGIVDVV